MDQVEILSECFVKIEREPDDEAEEEDSNSTESCKPYSLKRVVNGEASELKPLEDQLTFTSNACKALVDSKRKPLNAALINEGSLVDAEIVWDTSDITDVDLCEVPIVQVAASASDENANELLNFLNQSAQGLGIIGLHTKGLLDNSDRCTLARMLVWREYGANCNTQIRSRRFTELAQSIAKALPGELESDYYIATWERRQSHNAAGKLYDAYVNINRKLQRAGKRRNQITSTNAFPTNVNCTRPCYKEVTAADAQLKKKLKFLSTHIRPWEAVKSSWIETMHVRQTKLRDLKSRDLKVSDYIKSYPALLQPRGFTLLEHDFDVLFAEASGNFNNNWESFSSKVKMLLHEANVPAANMDCDAAVLYNFPLLFKVVPVRVPNSKPWRATSAEIKDGFLIHIKSVSELERRLQTIQMTAEAKGTHMHLVPVIVGESLSSITSSYVVIDNHPILLESPLKAVEVTLKAFHALNCNYPVQSSRPWAVIAQCLMGIQETWHGEIVNSPTVKHIIEKLR